MRAPPLRLIFARCRKKWEVRSGQLQRDFDISAEMAKLDEDALADAKTLWDQLFPVTKVGSGGSKDGGKGKATYSKVRLGFLVLS